MLQPEYWNYFRAIEDDLVNCTRFVELSEINYPTYSNEFAKIIILAGAETDQILNNMVEQLVPNAARTNISDYEIVISQKHEFFKEITLSIKGTNLVIQPWMGWTKANRPHWWSKSYNKLKHERLLHFQEANLKNALDALGGLYITILHFHHSKLSLNDKLMIGNQSRLFYPNTALKNTSESYAFAGSAHDWMMSSQ